MANLWALPIGLIFYMCQNLWDHLWRTHVATHPLNVTFPTPLGLAPHFSILPTFMNSINHNHCILMDKRKLHLMAHLLAVILHSTKTRGNILEFSMENHLLTGDLTSRWTSWLLVESGENVSRRNLKFI